LSEVINIIKSVDQNATQVQEQKDLIQEFTEHARLQPEFAQKLGRWATLAHTATRSVDVERMKEVLLSSALPRRLTKQMPGALYEGKLINNRFLLALQGHHLQIPARLPLMITLAAKMRHYEEKEVVYFGHDSTWNLHLVINGTFVHLAKPAALLSAHHIPVSQNLDLSAVTPGDLEAIGMTFLPGKDLGKNCSSFALSPYQIFSCGNYFGEAEIFLSQSDSSGSRRSAVRCETAGDTLLVNKKDINNLVATFPRAAETWYYAAARREAHRHRILKNLKMIGSLKELAASIIQGHVRDRLLQGKGFHLSTEETLASMTPAFRRSYAEQVPHYADKIQSSVDTLRREVKNDVLKLQREMSDLKSCMGSMQANLAVIASALQVKTNVNM